MRRRCKGSKEIGFTIVSMTVSLAAVFIPILFMGGILGRLFREFAVTITVAILISGVVSITLTPMLCSRFLRAHDPEQETRLHLPRRRNGSSRCSSSSTSGRLRGVLRVPAGDAGGVFRGDRADLVSVRDGSQGIHSGSPIPIRFQLQLQAAQGTSFYKMVEYQKRWPTSSARIPTSKRSWPAWAADSAGRAATTR